MYVKQIKRLKEEQIYKTCQDECEIHFDGKKC